MNAVIKYKYLTFLITLGFILFIAFNAKAEVLLLDAIESWPPKLTDANPVENVEEDKKENNGYFHFNYYFSGDVDQSFDLNLSIPISSSFSFLIRGSYIKNEYEVSRTRYYTEYYTYWVPVYRYSRWSGWYISYYRPVVNSYRQYYSYTSSIEETFWDGSALISWEPFIGSLLSPYIAAGARYSLAENDSEWDSSSEVGYIALAGLRVNLGILSLRGEYSLGSYGETDATEIIGDIGVKIFGSMQLHASYKIFDCDDADDSMSMYGAGISLEF